MKVTVCFGDVRVVVPCGDGSERVADLAEEAVRRYNKALLKCDNGDAANVSSSDNNLKLLQADGGILDWDDIVRDVIDDKEQLTAVYDVMMRGVVTTVSSYQRSADGTDGSSGRTSSPERVKNDGQEEESSATILEGSHEENHDVIVTSNDLLLTNDARLSVRRASDPVLTRLSIDQTVDPTNDGHDERIYENSACKELHAQILEEPDMSVISAQSRTEQKKPSSENRSSGDGGFWEFIVEFAKSSEPLGIDVIPAFDDLNRCVGLRIAKIHSPGRVVTDGRIAEQDVITDVNDKSLFDVEFKRAQDIFRTALYAPSSIRIKLVRGELHTALRPAPPPPTTHPLLSTNLLPSPSIPTNPPLQTYQRVGSSQGHVVSPAIPQRNPQTRTSQSTAAVRDRLYSAPDHEVSSTNHSARLIVSNHEIQLVKGADGLGFSITTRDLISDPATTTSSSIYVKTVFEAGAARYDGRLKSGDVILQLNGTSTANMSSSQVIGILRNTRLGETVHLVISRHDHHQTVGHAAPSANVSNVARVVSLPTDTDTDYTDYDDDDDEDENHDEERSLTPVPDPDQSSDQISDNAFRPIKFSGSVPVAAGDTNKAVEKLLPSGTTEVGEEKRNVGEVEEKVEKEGSECVSDSDQFDMLRGSRNFNQSFRAAVDRSYVDLSTPNDSISNTIHVEPMAVVLSNGLNNSTNGNKDNKKTADKSGKSKKGFGWPFRRGRKTKNDKKIDLKDEAITTGVAESKRDLNGESEDKCEERADEMRVAKQLGEGTGIVSSVGKTASLISASSQTEDNNHLQETTTLSSATHPLLKPRSSAVQLPAYAKSDLSTSDTESILFYPNKLDKHRSSLLSLQFDDSRRVAPAYDEAILRRSQLSSGAHTVSSGRRAGAEAIFSGERPMSNGAGFSIRPDLLLTNRTIQDRSDSISDRPSSPPYRDSNNSPLHEQQYDYTDKRDWSSSQPTGINHRSEPRYQLVSMAELSAKYESDYREPTRYSDNSAHLKSVARQLQHYNRSVTFDQHSDVDHGRNPRQLYANGPQLSPTNTRSSDFYRTADNFNSTNNLLRYPATGLLDRPNYAENRFDVTPNRVQVDGMNRPVTWAGGIGDFSSNNFDRSIIPPLQQQYQSRGSSKMNLVTVCTEPIDTRMLRSVSVGMSRESRLNVAPIAEPAVNSGARRSTMVRFK